MFLCSNAPFMLVANIDLIFAVPFEPMPLAITFLHLDDDANFSFRLLADRIFQMSLEKRDHFAPPPVNSERMLSSPVICNAVNPFTFFAFTLAPLFNSSRTVTG